MEAALALTPENIGYLAEHILTGDVLEDDAEDVLAHLRRAAGLRRPSMPRNRARNGGGHDD